MDTIYNNSTLSMYEAAINGNEQYFDNWLSIMKKNCLSITTIKSKIEKLDHEQYSVLHYTIRYNHLNLSRKFIEDFHCDVNLVGHDGETPLHTAARYEILNNSNIIDVQNNSITILSTMEQNAISCLISHQADLSKRDNYDK